VYAEVASGVYNTPRRLSMVMSITFISLLVGGSMPESIGLRIRLQLIIAHVINIRYSSTIGLTRIRAFGAHESTRFELCRFLLPQD
jgi:hypothetical protein